jgi:hypothetical protein
MRPVLLATTLLASALFAAPTLAAGVCSTGEYGSCKTCCATNAGISDRSTCSSQCEGYKQTRRPSPGQRLAAEPAPGTLDAGQRVLVDDGTCPAGQVKEVTGGNSFSGGTAKRLRRCVAR